MRAMTNFKLGLFAIAAIASFAVAVLALGLHTRKTPSREFHTLFDETVQGLDIGALVKYRGVRIGNVARIEVADDRRRVDVTLAIEASASQRLDLASPPPTLRARLESQGLTGVKFVDLDLADPQDTSNPPSHDRGYIASEPSLAKQLEDQGTRFGRSLPALVDDARGTLHRIDAMLDEVRADHVPEHLTALLDEARATLRSSKQLVPRASSTLAKIDATARDASDALAAVRKLTAHLDGDAGLAASATRATETVDEVGHRVLDATDGLDETLRDLGDASRALRTFVDELEREPDMLVKGHTPARAP
ncbi:MAG TPA: MlaD family protein [Kofleriaceae bacterium]|nr:MlaD family protein [Kofleriaceae bacterium]